MMRTSLKPACKHCSRYSATTLGMSFGEKAWRSIQSWTGTTTGSPKGESDSDESLPASLRFFLSALMASYPSHADGYRGVHPECGRRAPPILRCSFPGRKILRSSGRAEHPPCSLNKLSSPEI